MCEDEAEAAEAAEEVEQEDHDYSDTQGAPETHGTANGAAEVASAVPLMKATHTLKMGPLVSQGGTGSVYKAWLPDSPEIFAIKVVRHVHDSKHYIHYMMYEDAAVQLLPEMDVYQLRLRGLQAFAVPRVLEYGVPLKGEYERLPFLAMQLLGQSLDEYEPQLLPQQENALLVALAGIHNTGVLHGDVRTGSMMLPQGCGSGGGSSGGGSNGAGNMSATAGWQQRHAAPATWRLSGWTCPMRSCLARPPRRPVALTSEQCASSSCGHCGPTSC